MMYGDVLGHTDVLLRGMDCVYRVCMECAALGTIVSACLICQSLQINNLPWARQAAVMFFQAFVLGLVSVE
jgi:hypothetical protein